MGIGHPLAHDEKEPTEKTATSEQVGTQKEDEGWIS
jgi:hypothetical protein